MTENKNIRIYFPLVAVSQSHPIMDQYCTFLFLTALSRDAVRSLKCSSSLFPLFFMRLPLDSDGSTVRSEEISSSTCRLWQANIVLFFLSIWTVTDQTSSMRKSIAFDAMRRLGHVLCDTQSRCKNENEINKETSVWKIEGAMTVYHYGPAICRTSRN